MVASSDPRCNMTARLRPARSFRERCRFRGAYPGPALTNCARGDVLPFPREGRGYGARMTPIHVGLMADPAKPTEIARKASDLDPPGGQQPRAWDIDVVGEPFTVGCEDVDTALARLTDRARERHWDLVVGLT